MGSEDTIVTLWNIETGKCLLTLNGHSSPAVAIAFSPDGCTFASAAASIKIWHTETGDCLQNMQPNIKAPYAFNNAQTFVIKKKGMKSCFCIHLNTLDQT
ncbi:hypothetical protein CGMCC3_g6208 [Colletotrichum fructicola]|nr:uncharacterized protein CGMCC3_g6208 [Colletotrichum fructicola]KAE9577676.1 hypothetical protein CGMCC3_g6208 [Colletotrichum fructicola]